MSALDLYLNSNTGQLNTTSAAKTHGFSTRTWSHNRDGVPSQSADLTLWLKRAAPSPHPLRVFELIFHIDTSVSKKEKYFCACLFSSLGSPETRLLLLLFPAGLLFPLSSHPAVFTRQIKLQDTFKSKQLSTHISAFLGHVASPRTLTDYTLFFSNTFMPL